MWPGLGYREGWGVIATWDVNLVKVIDLVLFILAHEFGHAIVAWKDGAFKALGFRGGCIVCRTNYGGKPPRTIYIMGPIMSMFTWPLFGWDESVAPLTFIFLVLAVGLTDIFTLVIYHRADERGWIKIKNKRLANVMAMLGYDRREPPGDKLTLEGSDK